MATLTKKTKPQKDEQRTGLVEGQTVARLNACMLPSVNVVEVCTEGK